MIPSLHRAPDSLTDRNDETLASELQKGHEEALEVLFDRYSRLIFGLSRRILADEGEAEDTVQEVFMEVYRRISTFDPRKGSFKSWLMTSARHRAIDRRRHLQSTGFYQSVSLTDGKPPDSNWIKRLSRFSANEMRHFLGELLGALSVDERTVIDLHIFRDLTLEETHSALNSPLSAVRHLYYRAMKKLRAASTQTHTPSNPQKPRGTGQHASS
jgi:RNA polymerase sigma-70 factor (ECF subfamily)